MDRSRIEYFYRIILLVIFAGIVVHAPAMVMLSTLFPDYSLFIKSWKEILIIILIPLAIIILLRNSKVKEVINDWLIRLMILYIILHLLVMFIIGGNVISISAGLAIDLRYFFYFLLSYVLIKIWPDTRSLYMKLGIIGAFVVTGFATLQLFLPVDVLSHIGYNKDTIIPYLVIDQNYDFVRFNSTLRGPNPLGAYAVIVLAILIAAVVHFRKRLSDKKVLLATLFLGTLSLVTVWVSYSRSALIAALTSSTIVVLLSISRRSAYRIVAICGIAVLLATSLLIFSGMKNDVVLNVLLHKNPDSTIELGSNEGHIDSIETGVDRLIRQPLGGGVGSTGSASLHGGDPLIIENQYLFIAHEVGWLGLLLFLTIFVLVIYRLWQRRSDYLALGLFASGIGLALVGLLLPVWVDDTVAIIWWGLAAVALGRK